MTTIVWNLSSNSFYRNVHSCVMHIQVEYKRQLHETISGIPPTVLFYMLQWPLLLLLASMKSNKISTSSYTYPSFLSLTLLVGDPNIFFLLLQMATCNLFYLRLLLVIPFMDFVAPLMYLKQQGTIKAKGKYSIFNEIIQREYPLIFEPNC